MCYSEFRLKQPAGSKVSSAVLLFCLAVMLSGCFNDGSSQSSDPVVVENAVAYIKRPLLFEENGVELNGNDLREPATFRPGARVFLKDSAAPTASARDISSRAFSDSSFLNDEGLLRYDVRDLAVSYAGDKLLFSMRAPTIEGADEQDQPTWNIWEYHTASSNLRRVISSDSNAEGGHDIAPAYLPDGRIVFSSTRQRAAKAVLLDEGKPQFAALDEERETAAFALHIMASDGGAIEQITFNQSHDLDPTVLQDGRIVFSRWDNAGQTRNNGVNLYQVNPDGTGLSYLYGRHSHDSGGDGGSVQYMKPVAMEARRLLVQLRPFESATLSALPAVLDVGAFVEAHRTLDGNSGQGQVPLAAGVNAFGEPSLNGTYGDVSPLFDGSNRFLVSWSPCRVVRVGGDATALPCTEERLASGDYSAAAPAYGLWLLDATGKTQRPIERPQAGQQFAEAVLLISRPLPNFLPPALLSSEAQALAEAGYGIVHVRSVYDVDGVDTSPTGVGVMADPAQTAPGTQALRFVRIEKPVSQPGDDVRDIDNSAFGRSPAQLMREIVGYAPVEPDGSVRIAVPANIAFAISVLDAQGNRVTQRHQNWLQLRPGETVTCHGCHTGTSEVPHGRYLAEPASINPGAATTGLEFPNTRPVLVADMGETMAETMTRINGIRQLTPDIIYTDDWSNADVAPPADSFSYAYEDLQTPLPITPACADEWSSHCRIVTHYEQHIHPLWGLDRPVFDDDGVTVINSLTCTGCHTRTDDMGATQVPAAQLDLSDGLSPQNQRHFNAYRQLLFNKNELELVNGALVERLVDSGQVERDEEGEPILDENGDEIPIWVTVPVPTPMNTGGALASPRFTDRFAPGGSHAGFLSESEGKLIAEWLDLGAQYYNNPFDVPID